MRFQDVRLKGLGTGFLGAALLGLLLGTSGMVKAQDARDEAKPPQQEEPKQDEAKPPKQEEPKEAKPPKNEKQEEKQNSEMKPEKEQPKNDMRPGKEQDRAVQNNNGGDPAARASEQRGQRIPDEKFRSNFGRQHSFRVQTTVVEGQPRFQYGGYWFSMVDAWPVGWAYTDDCYIDFVDGEYVLIDLLHPGVQIAVLVVE